VRIGQVKELNMHKKVLVMFLAGTALPALALASSPLLVRFDGYTVPVRETVQVRHLPSGTESVRTYSWRAPNGAGNVQISEGPGARPAIPAWALAQMREMQMQMQMRQMCLRLIGSHCRWRVALKRTPALTDYSARTLDWIDQCADK
jgi:hypothetical protein